MKAKVKFIPESSHLSLGRFTEANKVALEPG
jgi:hypothetical protein